MEVPASDRYEYGRPSRLLVMLCVAVQMAHADNCGSLSDCYGTARSAAIVIGALVAIAALAYFVLPMLASALGSAGIFAGSQATLLTTAAMRTLLNAAARGDASRTIAGPGSAKPLRVAEHLAKRYGGVAADWASEATAKLTMPNGVAVEIHYFINRTIGRVVEPAWRYLGQRPTHAEDVIAELRK